MKESESITIFESLNTNLESIYDMAIGREDILSEDFSATLFSEIRNLEDRYGAKKLINQGGMKKVFKVEDRTTGRFVAMAFVQKNDPLQNERFLREARLTATLEHPNIMPVYDIGINAEDEPFFTMKLTGNMNLHEMIKERQKSGKEWPLVQKLNLFLSVCEGLSYAHSRHVVHLDIKPQNILVGEFGEVLICDWGLGRILFDEEEESEGGIDPSFFNEITMDGVIKGTPGYMAPEQINRALGDRDQRTDIYALGGILYALMSGHAPVKGSDVQEVFKKTLSGDISSLRSSACSSALEAVCFKMLAAKPVDRYGSIREVIAEVESYLGGFSTAAENAGFMRHAFLLMKRHKNVTGFLFVIIVLSSWFIYQLKKSEKHSRELLSLYEAEKQQTEMISKEASPHLVSQSFMNLYAYEYDLSREYADKAIKRDESNAEAWEVKALSHFYIQEFNDADKAFDKAPVTPSNRLLQRLSKQFGELKKDDERLSAEEFIKLLRQLPTQSQKRTLYRNEVLNYRSVTEHMKIINEMLYINNPHVKEVHFNFTQKDGKSYLDLTGNPEVDEIGCIRKMPLHYLNVEGLALPNREITQFRGMPLEELNIAGTQITKFDFTESTPNLKKLTISAGSCPPELLAELKTRMEVIEK